MAIKKKWWKKTLSSGEENTAEDVWTCKGHDSRGELRIRKNYELKTLYHSNIIYLLSIHYRKRTIRQGHGPSSPPPYYLGLDNRYRLKRIFHSETLNTLEVLILFNQSSLTKNYGPFWSIYNIIKLN